ncbi:MAG: hypothetical protein WAM80_10305 [Candidatus Acidiferrales bacterium]
MLDNFWKELGKIAKLTGFSRETIALILCRLNRAKAKEWEASLWSHTATKDGLRQWLIRCKEVSEYDDDALIEVARLLPEWARRSLSAIIKKLPAARGGKRKILLFRDRKRVKLRFRELTNADSPNRRSKNEAYKKIAKEVESWTRNEGRTVKPHPHTIRIICDPKERARSKAPKKEADSLPQDQVNINDH